MSSSLLGADERCIHSIYRVTASATVMRTKDHYSSEWYGAVRDNSCLIACRELPPPTLLLLRLLKRCNVQPAGQVRVYDCLNASCHYPSYYLWKFPSMFRKDQPYYGIIFEACHLPPLLQLPIFSCLVLLAICRKFFQLCLFLKLTLSGKGSYPGR